MPASMRPSLEPGPDLATSEQTRRTAQAPSRGRPYHLQEPCGSPRRGAQERGPERAWRGKQTSETRWVGAEAAVRELARLSRVSRTWQSYVLDGQLWQSLAFSDYPDMAEEAMISIANAVGPFVRRLDLHGLAGLRSSVLLALSKAQRARSSTGSELELGTFIFRDVSQDLPARGAGPGRVSTNLNKCAQHRPFTFAAAQDLQAGESAMRRQHDIVHVGSVRTQAGSARRQPLCKCGR